MKIGIVGLGLIGGSIFKDLISFGYDVVAVSNSQTGANMYNDYSVLVDCNISSVLFIAEQTNTILQSTNTE